MNNFSHIISVFHDRQLPEREVQLAGYAALIQTYDLQVPMPDVLSAISKKHKKYQQMNWLMLTPRHAPKNSLFGHLVYALKYEGVDLSVLKALFSIVDKNEIIDIVKQEPTGAYSRKIWFLFEWLQGMQLAMPDAEKGSIVAVINEELQYPGPSRLSKRHRVQNNLPGVPAFCPTIRRTKKLDQYINMKLNEKARTVLGAVHHDVLMRAAAFLLLKDSKASFAIENETPPQTRAERWGQAISQSGTHALSHNEFLRLQQIIISDFRFTHLGYRNEGGFVGDHERTTGMPIPEHISARWQDLVKLMEGLIECDKLLSKGGLDAVLAAALISFGFVFIHPFEDGNGRLHRYLIHHVLAEKGYSPNQIIFPISSVMLDNIKQYRETLESYSRPRLSLIKWRPTEKGNVEVLNDTINLYQYFDATKQAEFLYDCVYVTINKTLPDEISYLKKYDEMKLFIKNFIDMPDRTVDLLIRFLNQENGTLSKRARAKEFNSLKENEILVLEEKYAEIFQK